MSRFLMRRREQPPKIEVVAVAAPKPRPFVVLAFDPGFRVVGVALIAFWSNRQQIELVRSLRTSTSDGTDEHRLDMLADGVWALFDEALKRGLTVDLVAYENVALVTKAKETDGKPGSQSSFAARRMLEVVGIIRCAARIEKAPCVVVHPARAKGAMLGRGIPRGTDTKLAVQAAVRRQFGLTAGKDICDAVAVGVAGRRQHLIEQRRRAA